MKKLLFNNLLLTFCIIFGLSDKLTVVSCQSKYDYNWVIASNADGIPGIDAYVIDFNGGKRTSREISAFNSIHGGNSVISDKNGSLQFFTNGCEFMDTLGGIVANGEMISPGEIYDTYCPFGIYVGAQNSTILPDMYNDNHYYYLQKEAVLGPFGESNFALLYPVLHYSYIESTTLGSNVLIKSEKIDSSRYYFGASLESILHENGSDWWVVNYTLAEDGGKRLTYLLDQNGINLYKEEEYIDPNSLNRECSSAGQSAFSPDGKLYAKFCSFTGIDIFDFDRATGEFSNYRNFPISFWQNTNSGLAFSPNSQFIYISSGGDELYQLDLNEENLEDGFLLIGEYDGFLDPFPTNFTYMQLGPDCKIYMTSTNGVYSYHVINNPDEKGQDCNFVQHGFELPIANGTASIPNFPVFRFDGDEVCDPTITSVFDIPVEVVYDLELYPNPTNDKVIIGFAEVLRKGTLFIKSMSGQVLLKQEFDFSGSLEVSLTEYDAGMYMVEVVSGGKRYVDRVVKVD